VIESKKAVFLSYGSQDAEAARRICEALRAAGIEVWFDQSELPGEDAWDAAIRRQIKTCRLFILVISTNTHARRRLFPARVEAGRRSFAPDGWNQGLSAASGHRWHSRRRRADSGQVSQSAADASARWGYPARLRRTHFSPAVARPVR